MQDFLLAVFSLGALGIWLWIMFCMGIIVLMPIHYLFAAYIRYIIRSTP
jgi:hypothetical protein